MDWRGPRGNYSRQIGNPLFQDKRKVYDDPTFDKQLSDFRKEWAEERERMKKMKATLRKSWMAPSDRSFKMLKKANERWASRKQMAVMIKDVVQRNEAKRDIENALHVHELNAAAGSDKDNAYLDTLIKELRGEKPSLYYPSRRNKKKETAPNDLGQKKSNIRNKATVKPAPKRQQNKLSVGHDSETGTDPFDSSPQEDALRQSQIMMYPLSQPFEPLTKDDINRIKKETKKNMVVNARLWDPEGARGRGGEETEAQLRRARLREHRARVQEQVQKLWVRPWLRPWGREPSEYGEAQDAVPSVKEPLSFQSYLTAENLQPDNNVLEELFRDEMEKAREPEGVDQLIGAKKFPKFPPSTRWLEDVFEDPIDLLVDWMQFQSVQPLPFEKVSVDSLLEELGSAQAPVKDRQGALATIAHALALRSSSLKDPCESNEAMERVCEGLMIADSELDDALRSAQRVEDKKLQLGATLALVFVCKDAGHTGRLCLQRALESRVRLERTAAALAMASQRMRGKRLLAVLLEEWRRARTAATLHRSLIGLRWLSVVEGPSVAEALAPDLQSCADHHARLCACLALPFLEGGVPPSVLEELVRMLSNDAAPVVRLAAAKTLIALGQADPVGETLSAAFSRPDSTIPLDALNILRILKRVNPEVEDRLLPCLNSEDIPVKLAALDIIGKNKFCAPPVKEILQLLTSKENAYVIQGAAEVALDAIARPDTPQGDDEFIASANTEDEDNASRPECSKEAEDLVTVVIPDDEGDSDDSDDSDDELVEFRKFPSKSPALSTIFEDEEYEYSTQEEYGYSTEEETYSSSSTSM